MMWEPDFCFCKKCEQRWVMTEKGWRAVPTAWVQGKPVEEAGDPYTSYKGKGGKLRLKNAKPTVH